MIEIMKSAILGVVQGLTEFLPVSSSGHLVVLHEWLAMRGQNDLAFDAMLHFATALAVIVYFRNDIAQLLRAFFSLIKRSGQEGVLTQTPGEKMAVAIIVGTIPAVVFGLLLEEIMDTLFRNPLLVAGTLVLGSFVMLSAEKFGRYLTDTLNIKKGIVIGLFQSLALVPGMSRSGMTIAGGMFMGLSRAYAAKFGFLLGVPIMLGAGSKKLLDLSTNGALQAMGAEILVGALVAFVVGIAVIHYLLKFLNTHTLEVFVWYRVLLAVAIVVLV